MLTREEFCILNNLYDASIGRAQTGMDLSLSRALQRKDLFTRLCEQGLIDSESGEITSAGLAALEPYRVDSAVILAAGSATRFIPLSLEQPKALYEVRGERLIERQIQQLQEAGIRDITVVLGYKKDMLLYLEGKFGVRLIFNPAYNVKNNIESLIVCRKHIQNSYICVCDSYFIENPFHQYEFCSFCAGYFTDLAQDEFFAHIDGEGQILKMEKGTLAGYMLLGHSFWTAAFTDRFFEIAEADRAVGAYDDKFWEWLLKDHLRDLPPVLFKEYAQGAIFEFDYFDQLRQFDVGYRGHTRSNIIRNIKLVFRCDEEDIVDFRTVKEGLTNTSFVFQIDGKDYIYRHPGDGTESIINRRNEKNSLLKAKEYGFDPTYIYMDIIEGWKISEFIDDFRPPDYSRFEDTRKIAGVLRKLHRTPIRADYGLRPWEDALNIEKLLKEKNPGCFEQHEDLKCRIGRLYQKTIGDGVEKCFCHGDTYRPNWLMRPDGSVILIDWEYAGFSDPGVDVGYYIVDAMYDLDDARRMIRAYLEEAYTEQKEFHYLAYTAIIAYYWFVWALYRESCGAVIGESLQNWRTMAERYSTTLIEKYTL